MNYKARGEEEAFEEFCREVVSAARADQDVINAAADSAFLFQRVRAQLVADAAPPAEPLRLTSRFIGAPFLKWALGAAAIAVAVALLMFTRIARLSLPEPPAPALARTDPPLVLTEVEPVPSPEASEVVASAASANGKSHSARRRAVKPEEEEITTEYLPLTYAAYAEEADSGHVVRVQVPRAALLTLGVPIGAEVSTELVKADVIVGDDGLARAIRLVR